MMENNWANTHDGFNIHLTDKKAQIYNDTAILTYTLIISYNNGGKIEHKVVNETRVVIKFGDTLKVVHVHKSPGKEQ